MDPQIKFLDVLEEYFYSINHKYKEHTDKSYKVVRFHSGVDSKEKIWFQRCLFWLEEKNLLTRRWGIYNKLIPLGDITNPTIFNNIEDFLNFDKYPEEKHGLSENSKSL